MYLFRWLLLSLRNVLRRKLKYLWTNRNLFFRGGLLKMRKKFKTMVTLILFSQGIRTHHPPYRKVTATQPQSTTPASAPAQSATPTQTTPAQSESKSGTKPSSTSSNSWIPSSSQPCKSFQQAWRSCKPINKPKHWRVLCQYAQH